MKFSYSIFAILFFMTTISLHAMDMHVGEMQLTIDINEQYVFFKNMEVVIRDDDSVILDTEKIGRIVWEIMKENPEGVIDETLHDLTRFYVEIQDSRTRQYFVIFDSTDKSLPKKVVLPADSVDAQWGVLDLFVTSYFAEPWKPKYYEQ